VKLSCLPTTVALSASARENILEFGERSWQTYEREIVKIYQAE
jgi:hypothetical protein